MKIPRINLPHLTAFGMAASSLRHNTKSALIPPVLAVLAALLMGTSARAASGSWNGTTDGNWSTTTNWSSSPIPGANTGTTNADTATFNNAGGGNTTITVDSGRNIKSISFDTTTASYTIGGSVANAGPSLTLTSAGAISLLSTAAGTNLTETFNAPLLLEANYTFTNSRLDPGSSLVFAGNITNAATSLLTISGAGTGTGNLISGNISDGTGVQSVTVSASAGKWTLSGSNSYSGLTTLSNGGATLDLTGSNTSAGATTINTGTLQLDSPVNGGLASGLLTLTAGTVQALDAARSLSNAVTLTAATISGTENITFNGTLTGLTGGARTLTDNIATGNTLTLSNVGINTETANARTLTIAGTGNTTINGAISNGNATTANGLTITNTGLTTLSGLSTYTGATTISAGKLNVTGTLGATAISVAGGASLGGTGLIGNTGVSTSGTVNVAAGTTAATQGAINLIDGTIGTLTIQGNSGGGTFLTLAGASGSSSIVNFEVGTAGADSVAVTNNGNMLLQAGGATVNLSAISGQSLAAGTYNLISSSANTYTGAFTLGTAPMTPGVFNGFTLNPTATALQLIATGPLTTVSSVYWNGSQGNLWNTLNSGTSNWSTDATGATTATPPGTNTNVYFGVNNPPGAPLTTGTIATSLGQAFTINSLTFTGAGTSGTNQTSISGSYLLTLLASGTNGITVLPGAGSVVINSIVALGASQTWVNNSSNGLTSNATVTLGAGQVLTLSGSNGFTFANTNAISGPGSLVINGSETVTFGGSGGGNSSSFSGGITLNSGVLSAAGGGTGGASNNIFGTGLLTINGGTISGGGNIANGGGITGISGQLWNGDWTLTGGKSVTLGGPVSLGTSAGTTRTVTVLNSASTFTVPGVISNGTTVNSLRKAGPGLMVLSGANTYTGATSITGGILSISGANGSLATSSSFTATGGTLQVDDSAVMKNNRLGSGPLTLQNGGFNLIGSGTGSASESIGTLTLDTGANTIFESGTFTGGSAGSLTASSLVRNNNATAFVRGVNLGQASSSANQLIFTTAPSGSAGTLIGGGATLGGGNTNVSIIPFMVGDTGTAGTGTTFVGYDPVNGVRALNLATEYKTSLSSAGVNDNVLLSSPSTAVALTSATINSLILDEATATGAVTYTLSGVLTPNSGALLFSKSAGTAQSVTLTGGTLQFAGSNSSTSSEEGNIMVTSTATVTIASPISGSGGLTLSTYNAGSGIKLTSTGNNYTGPTTINGTVTAGASNVIPDGSSVYVALGSTLNFNAVTSQTETIGSLAGAGTVNLAATSGATLTVGNDNTSTNFSGTISGASGKLTKIGSGTQTLSGTSTYTGATTVSGGTLIVSGSLSGTPTVNVNTTGRFLLSGNGLYTNPVNPAANVSLGAITGGTLAMTNDGTNTAGSLSSQTFAGLTLVNTSTIDLGSNSTGNGNKLLFTGATSLTGYVSLTINDWSGSVYTAGATTDPGTSLTQDYLLFASDPGFGALGTSIASISFYNDNGVFIGNGMEVVDSANGNYELVAAAAVPEPQTWAMILGGTGMLMAGQRIRRRLSMK